MIESPNQARNEYRARLCTSDLYTAFFTDDWSQTVGFALDSAVGQGEWFMLRFSGEKFLNFAGGRGGLMIRR